MSMRQAFPNMLKQWRTTRRMSQLDLGLAANVSARHISFLETGRSMPSRSMVLQLCQTLEVPRPAQNTLLQAAGFAEVYRSRQSNDAELTQVNHAMTWTLERHDPYPGFVFDKHWTIMKANRAATLLLNAVGLGEGDNLLLAMQSSPLLKAAISNWQEVLRHMISRLSSESSKRGSDEYLDRAVANLTLQLNDRTFEHTTAQVVLSTRYVLNGLELSLFSMLAQFSSVEDIALADMRVELMFPADQATADFLKNMVQLESPA